MTRQLVTTRLSDVPLRRRRMDDWGPWQLDPDNLTLYVTDPYYYEIDLEACTTSAEVLDWICQITEKHWDNREAVIVGLVRAFNDVLHPQANLCSFGRSQQITRHRVAELVAQHEAGERE